MSAVEYCALETYILHAYNISTDVQNGVDSHYVRTALTRKVGSHKSVAQHTCATQARHQWQHICSDVCSQGVCTAVRKHMHRHFSPTRAPSACTGVAVVPIIGPQPKGKAHITNCCASGRCVAAVVSVSAARKLVLRRRWRDRTLEEGTRIEEGVTERELLTIRGAIVHSETSENTRGHSRTDVALPAVVHVQVLLGHRS